MMRCGIVWFWALALTVGVLVVATSRYSTDMSVFLPRQPSEREQLLIDQIRDGALSRMILVGIDGGTPAQRADASQRLAAALRGAPAFIGAVNGDAASRAHDQALLLAQRYVLSPAVTPARFGAHGLHEAIAQTVTDLSGSAGMLLKALLPRDPTGELLRVLDLVSGGNAPNSAEGVWASPDGQRALLITMTHAPGTDTDAQEQALDTLCAAFASVLNQRFAEQIRRESAPCGVANPRDTTGYRCGLRLAWHRFRQIFSFNQPLIQDTNANPQGQLTLRISGTPVFSVQARTAIKSDIQRLSILGSLGVFTLLLLVYRSLRNVIIGLLPVLSGIVAGIAAVGLGFQTVHAVTIGFGTTLMGEAVDYSIYYLVQAQDRQTWQQRFWPTVRLGVATSICGFAVLWLSSFPGLAQLGVYSVAGLVTAATVTRLVLPALPTAPVPLARLARIGQAVDRVRATAQRLRWVAAALAVLALGTVVLHHDALWARGLAGLNPAPLRLQQLDTELRRDAGAPDLQHMIVATAATQEQALELAERAQARLVPLIERGIIARLDSPAHFLPSAATQQARRGALPAADVLQARLEQALQELPLTAARLAPFVQDVQQARNAPPLTAAALQGTSFAFAVQTLLLERAHGWSVLMPVQLGNVAQAAAVPAIEQALAAAPAPTLGGQDLFYLDLEQQTSQMFGQYLQQALLLASLGVLSIVLLLIFALRRLKLILRVIFPLAGAVLLVMAAHVLLGAPMTLLHLVGLLLIVAVGSNYTLFFVQGIGQGHQAGTDTNARLLALASLGLANLATMLGFGILAFSQVPVLHALGATVGPGALLALWLSMAWSSAKVER
jgi:predicted exporter